MAATGSRIPGAQVECPAPIMVIAAEGIRVHGLVDTAAIIRWVTWTYDGNRRLGATDLMKATVNYQMTPNAALTFTVDNLLDMQPGNGHKTWTSDPYDARSGFRPVGRAFFLEVNYRFGWWAWGAIDAGGAMGLRSASRGSGSGGIGVAITRMLTSGDEQVVLIPAELVYADPDQEFMVSRNGDVITIMPATGSLQNMSRAMPKPPSQERDEPIELQPSAKGKGDGSGPSRRL